MAADSSMGFHQGITAAAASAYNHHMLSFQSSSDGGGAAGTGLPAPRSMGGASGGAGPFLSPNGTGAAAARCKFVGGSPSEWSDWEINILKEGLARYACEPNIMKYVKIAAMLPNRTIRDVALRCWWATGKDRRRKPDGFFTGKKIRDLKPIQDKMVTSASVANFHTSTTNMTPFSISMQHPNQQCQVPKEGPVVDSATQHLLEENNRLLNQIAANIETFKMEGNMGLFLQTNNNIKIILSRMSKTTGIMGQMLPLPESVNEDKLNSLLQAERMLRLTAQRVPPT